MPKNTSVKKVTKAKSQVVEQPVESVEKSGEERRRAEKSGEELVLENFEAVSTLIGTLAETIDMLVQKTENMAYHIIATEQLLAELVVDNGINLPNVNARIRNMVASGTDNLGDPSRAIDIAAAIASPMPRK